MDCKTLSAASKLAQWRAAPGDAIAIKAARKARRAESVIGLIRRYVSQDDISKIKRRGCLHSADFPEKRSRGGA